MKKYLRYILPILFIGILVFNPLSGHIAHADTTTTCNISAGSVFSGFNINACLQTGLAWVAYTILTLVSWLVGIAGLVLNSAIYFGILNMKTELDKISAVNAGWTMIRDIGNMAFIFILLYIAIATILNIGNIDTKRTIRNVIIVGLLVNFSLFFTKVMIDASNVVTISFYNEVVNNNGSTRGFAETFSRPLGISQFFKPTDFTSKFITGDSSAYTQIAIVGIAGSVFLFAVALSFLYVAFLIIVRFIILIILLALSPLPFFASILPSTRPYATKWWDALRNQLIFAPLYMILLFIVMLLNSTFNVIGETSQIGPQTSSTLLDALAQNSKDLLAAGGGLSGGTVDAILRFVVMIFFLNLAAIVATQAANNSGGLVGGVVNKVRNTGVQALKKAPRQVASTGATVVGGTIGASARTVGNIGSGVTGNGFNRFKYTEMGRSQAASEKLDKKEEDLKRTALEGNMYQRWSAKRQLTKLSEKAKPFRENRDKGAEEVLTDINKFGGATKPTQDRIKSAKDAVKLANEQLLSAIKANDPTARRAASEALKDANDNLARYERRKQREIKEQRATRLNELAKKHPKKAKYKKAAQNFAKSNKPPTEAELNKQQAEETADDIRDNISDAAYVQKVMNGMNEQEIKNLPGDILVHPNVIPKLDVAALKAIQKNGKLRPAQKTAIGSVIIAEARTRGTATTGRAAELDDYLKNSKNYWGTYP